MTQRERQDYVYVKGKVPEYFAKSNYYLRRENKVNYN